MNGANNLFYFDKKSESIDNLTDAVAEGLSAQDNISARLEDETNIVYIEAENYPFFEDREFAGAHVLSMKGEQFLAMYSNSLSEYELLQRAEVFAKMHNDTYGFLGHKLNVGYNPFSKEIAHKNSRIFKMNNNSVTRYAS